MYWDLFVGALITTAGGSVIGGIVWLIKLLVTFRQENRDDHDKVMKEIKGLKKSVDHVGQRMTDHIEWHLKKR